MRKSGSVPTLFPNGAADLRCQAMQIQIGSKQSDSSYRNQVHAEPSSI